MAQTMYLEKKITYNVFIHKNVQIFKYKAQKWFFHPK